jgi:plastocyanin
MSRIGTAATRASAAGWVLAAWLLSTAPAGAADHTVVAGSNVFAPADITITQGDTVTWANTPGEQHNVRFDDNSFEMPLQPDSSAWSVSRVFAATGTFRYYCEEHGAPAGVGMSGAVYVNAPAPPPPSQSGQPVFADKTAPALKLYGPTRQRVVRQRSVYVLVRVDEPSRVVARGRITIGTGSSFRAKTVTKQVSARTTTRFGLTFTRPKVRTFGRALGKHRRLRADITVTARDAAGNTRSAKRRLKLKK